MQTGVRYGCAQIRIDDSGLNGGALILDIDCENTIHARENDDDSAFASERTAGEPSARAATDDRSLIAIGDFDDAHDVGRGARENDAIGTGGFDGAIVFVEHHVFRAVENAVRTEKFLKIVEKA